MLLLELLLVFLAQVLPLSVCSHVALFPVLCRVPPFASACFRPDECGYGVVVLDVFQPWKGKSYWGVQLGRVEPPMPVLDAALYIYSNYFRTESSC